MLDDLAVEEVLTRPEALRALEESRVPAQAHRISVWIDARGRDGGADSPTVGVSDQ